MVLRAYARLPVKDHTMWNLTSPEYYERFVKNAFPRNTEDFRQCIRWCFHKEKMHRQAVWMASATIDLTSSQDSP